MIAVRAGRLPLPLLRSGKVREVYEVDSDRLLLVASDRVSAFDVVMKERVPFKGAVLTQLTAWWLRQLEGVVPHHMLTSNADEGVAGESPKPKSKSRSGGGGVCSAATAAIAAPPAANVPVAA